MVFSDAHRKSLDRSCVCLAASGHADLRRIVDFSNAINRPVRTAAYEKVAAKSHRRSFEVRKLRDEIAQATDYRTKSELAQKLQARESSLHEAREALASEHELENAARHAKADAYHAEFRETVAPVATTHLDRVFVRLAAVHALRATLLEKDGTGFDVAPTFAPSIEYHAHAHGRYIRMRHALGITQPITSETPDLSLPDIPPPGEDVRRAKSAYHEAVRRHQDARTENTQASHAYEARETSEALEVQQAHRTDLVRMNRLDAAERKAAHARDMARTEYVEAWRDYCVEISSVTQQFAHDVLAEDLKLGRAILDALRLIPLKIDSIRPGPPQLRRSQVEFDIQHIRWLWRDDRPTLH